MVAAADGAGCAYWAITDHSESSFQANGLDAARVRKQIAEVQRVNARLADEGNDFRLLTGSEVDILRDGLDFDDDLLGELEVVVAGFDDRDGREMAGNSLGLVVVERAGHHDVVAS